MPTGKAVLRRSGRQRRPTEKIAGTALTKTKVTESSSATLNCSNNESSADCDSDTLTHDSGSELLSPQVGTAP